MKVLRILDWMVLQTPGNVTDYAVWFVGSGFDLSKPMTRTRDDLRLEVVFMQP